MIDDDFKLTEKACTILVRQVCEAMKFVHSNNIIHLDLKPENILCLTRDGNRIKIIDFGLARRYDPNKKLQVILQILFHCMIFCVYLFEKNKVKVSIKLGCSFPEVKAFCLN